MLTDNSVVYVQLHIPKTAGTAFQNQIGSAYNKQDDNCWQHYHWEEASSPWIYSANDIPLLINRTKEQQRQIKVISGHSTFCNTHRWLKISREPRYITFVRDPIKRILSSFNHRHARSTLMQDNSIFSTDPVMNTNAYANKNTADDYNTLYEFYKDAYVEHNMQTKWIIKSFLRWQHGNWQPHPTYDGMLTGSDYIPLETVPPQIPEWFWLNNDYDYWNVANMFMSHFWWISADESQTQNIKDFCKFIDIKHYNHVHENKTGDKVAPYWTIDDVMKQPDIENLIKAEIHDYSLFNYVKENCRRPF